METTTTPETVKNLHINISLYMDLYRKLKPKARRTSSTAIIHSGGKQTIYGCVCGAEHTTSTDWHGRDAKHVQVWRAAHKACVITVVSGWLAKRAGVVA